MKNALKEIKAIFYVLATTHIIWIRASSLQESYISLENYVRNTNAIKHKIPVNVAGNSTLLVTYRALQILKVDELNQSVQVLSVLMFYWSYPEIHWNVSQYNGIWSIDLDSADVWTPTIVIPRSISATIMKLSDKVQVNSNGQLMSMMPGIQEISCFLDLLDFPFDRHNCSIQFMEVTGINVYPEMESIQITEIAVHFIKNAEWRLDSYYDCGYVQKGVLNYTECWFVMSRQQRFYLTTLLSPLILMSAMTLLVFCLPVESGEKVSFVISIFVSMTMFLSIITDVIPRSMNQIPRFLVLILVTVVVIFLSAAATVVVVNRYDKEKTRRWRETKNKQTHTEMKQSTHHKGTDLIYSMQNNDSVFPNSGEKAMSLDRDRRDWDEKESQKNKSALWATSMTTVGRNSNRISDTRVSREKVESRSRENIRSCAMWFCNLTHGQLDTMFFWLFFCLNVIVYTSLLGVYIY